MVTEIQMHFRLDKRVWYILIIPENYLTISYGARGVILKSCYRKFNDDGKVQPLQRPLLLTWFNFDPSVDK